MLVNRFFKIFSERILPILSDDLEGLLEVVGVNPLDEVAKALDLDSAVALALAEVGNHGHGDHGTKFFHCESHGVDPFY